MNNKLKYSDSDVAKYVTISIVGVMQDKYKDPKSFLEILMYYKAIKKDLMEANSMQKSINTFDRLTLDSGLDISEAIEIEDMIDKILNKI